MKHKVEEIELKNGAKGLLIDVDDAPVMNFIFNFRAGDYLTPEGKWETAHLLEHLMLGANQDYPKARLFQSELEKNGAYFNAYTNSYEIGYVGECADFEWKRIFELYLSALEKPLLLEEEFKAESGNVREELSADLNEHFRQLIIASRQAQGFVALPDGKRLAQLNDIEVADLRGHYEKTHTTKNLRFIISGRIGRRRDQIVARLEELSFATGERIDLPDEKPKNLKGPLYVDRVGVDNIYFAVNFVLPRLLQNSEEYSLQLLNTILTSTLHSGILGEAREKGLAYSLSSWDSKGRGYTGWWFGAQLLEGNSKPVFEIITKHVSRAIDGKISKNSVEAAKKYTIGRIQRNTQTVGSLARGYSSDYFFDGKINYFDQVVPNVKAVTQQSITKVARSILDEKHWALSVLSSGSEDLTKALHGKIAELWS